ncbi:hypothetical protein [Bradyrhizobium sp. USDA 4451]
MGEVDGDAPADLAIAEDADRDILRAALRAALPDPVTLLGAEGGKAALVPDRMPGNEARHHLALSGIDHAHHVDAGRQARTGHDVVDAGGDRAHRLQIGIALERVVGRMPGEGETDIRGIAGVIDHLDPRRNARQLGAEIVAQIEPAADQDTTHGSGRTR